MNKLFDFFKVLIVPLIAFIILPLIISVFNLFGLQINKIFLIIISSLIMLGSGFLIGKKALKKGFISGAILGFCFLFILFILGLFFGTKFSFSRLVYYIILVLSCMLGSIVGINKKKSN